MPARGGADGGRDAPLSIAGAPAGCTYQSGAHTEVNMLGPSKMSLALAGSLLAAGMSPLAAAASRLAGPDAVLRLGPQPVTITGCLEEGDEQGEFHLTTKDGKTYDVKSTTVPLAKHVGHTVSITGTPVKPEPGEEKQGEAGELEVTAMKHLSETCKK